MSKQMIFSDEARSKLMAGVSKLASAVKITMGPKGRNVVLEKQFGYPIVVNDGVTIAKEIDLEDKYENMGAQLVKEVATKTNDLAGDGTTTATVLAEAILKEGIRQITAGANPIALRHGINKATKIVIEELRKQSKAISSKKEIAQVASISSSDTEIGDIIAGVLDKIGKDGVVTIEEGQTPNIEVEYTEGMEIDNGFVSPYMMTKEGVAEYKDVEILVTDYNLTNIEDLIHIINKLGEQGKRNLVIIADDIDSSVLATLVFNKVQGVFNTLAIKAPAFGDRRKAILEDIAILTGATFISSELGLSLKETKLEDLGKVKSVKSNKSHTTIVANDSQENVSKRILQIKAEIEQSSSDFDKEKLQERLAKLAGGVAVIKVGASTETEATEKKLRVEDALSAAQVAIEEGIVEGGGMALMKASKKLSKPETRDEEIAFGIVKKALEEPMSRIAENAGKNPALIIEQALKEKKGYNAANDTFEDLIEAGIIDPLKVTRSALENAASLTATFLTTEVAITEIENERDNQNNN